MSTLDLSMTRWHRFDTVSCNAISLPPRGRCIGSQRVRPLQMTSAGPRCALHSFARFPQPDRLRAILDVIASRPAPPPPPHIAAPEKERLREEFMQKSRATKGF